jgi:steroid delta-isomerase-like uncharacterized protein
MSSAGDLVRAHYDAFNQGDFDAWPQLLDPHIAVHHGSGPGVTGRDAFLEGVRLYRRSFPDFKLTLHRVIDGDGDGDMVAAHFTSYGTFATDYHGIPATGARWELNGMGFYRVDQGRLAEMWIVEDLTGWLGSLTQRTDS